MCAEKENGEGPLTPMNAELLENFHFRGILDGIKANIYISDPDTDEILFMNQTMKNAYGLSHPEGGICYKALQKNMQGHCPFCVVNELKDMGAGAVINWEETSSVNGRIYSNYDSLIRWLDGRLVHLQQSIDITELKYANTDELTQLLTRRPGKDAMRTSLMKAKENGESITVCLYDINQLKVVNDHYGHAEGDHLITTVSKAVENILNEGDYSFRLSGDEFIIIFKSSRKSARQRMDHVKRLLKSIASPYEISFCYGLVEIDPNSPISQEEALSLADERMYKNKKQFHIMQNNQIAQNREFITSEQFTYNKDLLYDALIQSTDSYIYICNMKTGIFRYPPAMVEEFELPCEVIQNAASVWGSKVHMNDRPAFLESNQEITDGRTSDHCVEYRAKNRRGEWVWVRCRGKLMFDADGEPELFAGFITNLSLENRIDHITGLPNKLKFEDAVLHQIETASGNSFGVMLLGIDDLKHINDLYDRTFGDEVIRITGQKLRALLPQIASLYKLDGDEFGILIHETSREQTISTMDKIYRTIGNSFEIQQEYNGRKYYCSLSAGCLVYPDDAKNFLDIAKYAGYSLQYSKKHGKKRCTHFSPELLAHRSKTLELIEELRNSIENDFSGFTLNYQPLVQAGTGTVIGLEALARWSCRQYGKISPMEFIPLLEQSGLIIPLGKWVIKTALHAFKHFQRLLPHLILNVNISYLQVQEPGFSTFLKDEIRHAGTPAGNLVLEFTESYFAGEYNQIHCVFEELRKLGVHIAMDDFGTGYSSLGILKEVPADIVKIDKTFVRGIQESNFDATFIRFIVELCHNVGIKVCLEGVETKEEYDMVNQMGLDMIQGFYFARPLSEEELTKKYLEGQNT